MTNESPESIGGDSIYFLTYLGSAEITGAGTSLSPAELELLVLIDGKATVSEIENRAINIERDAIRQVFSKLLNQGLIAPQELDLSQFFSSTPATLPDTGAPEDSVIERGVSSLQQNGYVARIARRSLVEHRLAQGERLTLLVVEDDPLLAKLMQASLEQSGFTARMAANRKEIVDALRQPPIPDLMLLDVMLPDADGFDVLSKVRQHPALKAVPVIMATGKATREAVLKGLLLGANGYITKPFQVEVLIKAVRVVLGIDVDDPGSGSGAMWHDERIS